ncbi:MAG: aminopeptidase P family protein [Candidatus Eisenbacteria bacterium]|nr:aminopeptidase P family protein [Candidatus Eisenbacteria bacterium]
MKRDIDGLMKERGIDVAIITGAVKGNATMYYMVNGAAISHAIVIKKAGEDPVLFCGTMEREEAAASGLKTIDTSKYNVMQMMKDAGGDRRAAMVSYYRAIFDEFGIDGKVAFYGLGDVGRNWELLKALDAGIPNVTVMGEFSDDLFLTARATKGPEEVARIREVGRKTCEVVSHMMDYMTSHKVKDGALIRRDGGRLTIGDCKSEIKMELARRNLIEEVDTIFAIGRDAGIPHSRGNDDDPIELGKTLVFDIFPQEEGGGYFFDMTRTFVLGSASQDILDAYKTLEECFDAVAATLKAGERASVYQTATCDFFEARGIETPRTNPQVTNGYVHSLGHGVGVEIHEKPTLSDVSGNKDILAPGSVFTFEPGLYYPDKGYGMRIEDVYYVHDDGTMENLTNFPRGLILGVSGD